MSRSLRTIPQASDFDGIDECSNICIWINAKCNDFGSIDGQIKEIVREVVGTITGNMYAFCEAFGFHRDIQQITLVVRYTKFQFRAGEIQLFEW